LPTAIGSVGIGANLETGEGITLKKPFTMADLSGEDRQKIARWLQTAGAEEPANRPGFASLDAKLDQVLALIATGALAPEQARPVVPAAARPPLAGSALERLEYALEAAVQELAAQAGTHTDAGVRLTKMSHAGLEPSNPGNRLDVLQARANRVRLELFPKFQRACQELGLMKGGVKNYTLTD
jgi:hypothetical protein